eukprot:TRINITY_DN58851_c0_g1_i1.p1 TRINITY_DN58851_c0_g1~~TRINITY_DN58851_c0_g1_i1.p1  ORF type:complete len:188 (+),score=24.01 TRINITY_DN58851_c0_g1_i1:134-697(+)
MIFGVGDTFEGGAVGALEKVTHVFRQYDINRDGTIDLSEFSYLLSQLDPDNFSLSRARQLFSAADVNNDGRLGTDEFLSWIFQQGELREQAGVASLDAATLEGNRTTVLITVVNSRGRPIFGPHEVDRTWNIGEVRTLFPEGADRMNDLYYEGRMLSNEKMLRSWQLEASQLTFTVKPVKARAASQW